MLLVAKLVNLSLICAFLFGINVRAQKKVLFYGPTFQVGGVAANLVNNNPTEFFAIGSGSDVWTPGGLPASKDWSKKTLADFQAFDAIVFDDPISAPDPSAWAGAIANRDIWSPAITGNVFIFGGDPEDHASHGQPGATTIIEQSLRFVVASGRGFYIALSDTDPTVASPVHPLVPLFQDLLGGLGQFTLEQAAAEVVRKLYSHPTTDCVSEEALSFWQNSCHGGFLAFPTGYLALAIATDVAPEKRTPSSYLPTGEQGLAFILAKGSFKQFYLTPRFSGKALGATYTATAKYLSETGSGISGATVFFEVVDGPNFGQSATRTTDGAGTATWSYPGNGGAGRDTILATLTSSGQTCAPTARAFVDWAVNVVTISSSVDPNAGEPATLGGSPNPGTFTITRTGSTAASLDVAVNFGGTATFNIDYTANTVVTIGAGLSSAPLVVTPLFDGVSEITETVIGQIADLPGNYAIGSPAEATINITSSTTDTVTLLIQEGLMDESGNNPATVKLHRTGSSGDAVIKLEFTGTATFGDDYIVETLNADNTATIPSGQQDLFLMIDPVPDTRWEGSSESVTITVKAAPDGSYALGSPIAQTLNINDDDVQQIPASGWKLVDIGTFGGNWANAFGINTISIGGGQYRGQVAGFQVNSQSPAYKGAFWDNGTYTFRNWPSSWPLQQGASPWSQTWGLNDAGTVVGNSTYYWSMDGYHQWPCYWNSGSTAPILLPLLFTEFSLDNYAYSISQRDYINDTGGIIVGSQKTANPNVHAVMWLPNADETYPSSGLVDLGDIGDGLRTSYAYSINQLGEVVGKSQVASSSVYHAFRTRFSGGIPVGLDSSLDDMGTGTFADGNTSEAGDINNYGELIGASQFPGNLYHAAYKSPDTLKNLGWYRLGVLAEGTSNAGTQSIARGINDKGLIVGKSQIKVNNLMVWHGFVMSNQGNPNTPGLLDLNNYAYVLIGSTWLSASSDGWIITNAEKINTANWIVGWGTKNGAGRAFVLSPR